MQWDRDERGCLMQLSGTGGFRKLSNLNREKPSFEASI